MSQVFGKRVLEIGAGCGLPGLSTLPLGCTELVLTDIESTTVNVLTGNLQRTTTSTNASCAEFDFRDVASANLIKIQKFDLIIGSETIYERGAVEAFVRTIRQLLADDGFAIIVNRIRPLGGSDMREQFILAAESNSLAVTVAPTSVIAEAVAEGFDASGIPKHVVSGCCDENSLLAFLAHSAQWIPALQKDRQPSLDLDIDCMNQQSRSDLDDTHDINPQSSSGIDLNGMD